MSDISGFLTNNLWIIVGILLLAAIFKYVADRNTGKNQNREEKRTTGGFIPSVMFKGEKKGYVFKTDNGNTGYYIDI